MKTIFCSLLLVLALRASAGITMAMVGVDGLTCSACSFATQRSILKLDFVDTIVMDLNNNIAKVTFKKGKVVSIEALAGKVVEAGFSVRFISAFFDTNNVIANDGFCFEENGSVYQFIGIVGSKVLTGSTVVKFVGEKYCSKKEFKKWMGKL